MDTSASCLQDTTLTFIRISKVDAGSHSLKQAQQPIASSVKKDEVGVDVHVSAFKSIGNLFLSFGHKFRIGFEISHFGVCREIKIIIALERLSRNVSGLPAHFS